MGIEWIIIALAVALAAGYLARRGWRKLAALRAAGSGSCGSVSRTTRRDRGTSVRLTVGSRNIR